MVRELLVSAALIGCGAESGSVGEPDGAGGALIATAAAGNQGEASSRGSGGMPGSGGAPAAGGQLGSGGSAGEWQCLDEGGECTCHVYNPPQSNLLRACPASYNCCAMYPLVSNTCTCAPVAATAFGSTCAQLRARQGVTPTDHCP